MSGGEAPERRRFVRIEKGLAIRYKFLSLDPRVSTGPESYEGRTHNISQGGLLLIGKLPDPEWGSRLLRHRIVVGVTVELTKAERGLRAVCRTAWLEPMEGELTAFGLAFSEVTQEDQDRLIRFILGHQL
jgi:c-di-GMP-binding flagellar brake protein YcgR